MRMHGPTAKKIVLDLLLAVDPEPLAARDAVNACALFGVRESNVRVTLTRLCAEGHIESTERGCYRLGTSAHQLATEVAGWRRMAERIRPWHGDYIAVHTAELGRSDRTALRRRQRAIDMLGFRPLRRDLFVRPDNIDRDIHAVRRKLINLGLEAETPVFIAHGFSEADQQRMARLWDGEALNADYHATRQHLEAWLARHDTLDTNVAARESFLIGGEAIRKLVFDPLLPEPMVDVEARRRLLDTTLDFDRVGKRIWRTLVRLDPLPRSA